MIHREAALEYSGQGDVVLGFRALAPAHFFFLFPFLAPPPAANCRGKWESVRIVLNQKGEKEQEKYYVPFAISQFQGSIDWSACSQVIICVAIKSENILCEL